MSLFRSISLFALLFVFASVSPAYAQEPDVDGDGDDKIEDDGNPADRVSGLLDGPGDIGDPGDPGGGTEVLVPEIEWHERSSALQAHDFGLLGDSIDPHTGALSFTHTDVSLPGNSGLSVAVTRSLRQGYEAAQQDFLGGWTLEIPRMSVVTAVQSPWTGARCSNPQTVFQRAALYPPSGGTPEYVYPSQFSNGLTLDVPGAGSMEVLTRPGTSTAFPAGQTYHTDTNWYLTCTTASDGGEGFYAYAPNGDRYRLDRYRVRDHSNLDMSVLVNGLTLMPASEQWQIVDRVRASLYATEVMDVHGNWVRYTYDSSDRVTRIYSNDGRDIRIYYSGSSNNISSVVANGRTWTYNTQGSALTSVTLPDGRSWSLSLTDMNTDVAVDRICPTNPSFPGGSIQVSLTHPDGVTGTFTLQSMGHRQALGLWKEGQFPCPGTTPPLTAPPPGGGSTVFRQELMNLDHDPVTTLSVTQKTLSGPAMPTSTWTYEYEQDIIAQIRAVNGAPIEHSAGDPTNWTRMVAPDGVETTYYHFWSSRHDGTGGELDRVEIRATAGGAIVETQQYEYVTVDELKSSYLPYVAGDPSLNNIRGAYNSPFPVRQSSVETVRGGVTYSVERQYNSTLSSSAYSYGRPTRIERSSTLQAGSRITDITYRHDKPDWILAQTDTVTQNGAQTDRYYYNSVGQVTRHDRFGAEAATYGYLGNGQLSWTENALGERTSFGNYHRGVPRLITLPDTNTVTSLVDNNGWVTRVTDPRGTIRNYTYTAMGWMTGIDRPSGYTDTTISYSSAGNGVVATSTTGAMRETVTHDGLNRPTLVRQQALSGGGGNIYTRTQYDNMGRTSFVSFPSTSSNPTQGVTTSYDAFGRVTQSQENVAPYATTTTAYLSNNRTRVTDPEGNITTTTYSGYGSPDDGNPVQIAHPMGLTTAMTYDIWGNLLTARQYGNHNGYAVDQTQTWRYDTRQRLCRHSVPETGDTLYAYDNADRITGIARGQSTGTACSTLPAASRVTQVWDNRGRLDQVLYPDASPDVDYGYDANGNMTSAVRGTTSWAYQYNALDAITQETLTVDGLTFTTGYTRNADGYVTHQTTPAGRSVSYLPDGFGRATRVRVGSTNYAASASYHPSGGLAALSYGNGRALSMTYNTRQLVTDMTVSGGGTLLDFDYGYNANAHITSIDDNVVAGQDRSFTYDDLNRLLTASGPWGSGSFVYDPLGNIRRQTLGSRVVEVNYNSANRVSQARDTGAGNVWRSYSYDSRGNTTSNGQLNWVYDRSEQPVTMTGTDTGSFVYDAHNRRVRQVINGETIYSVYTASGAMVFRNNTTAGTTTDYLRLGGRTVVRLDQSGGATYTHADHLGSPVAATNASGTLLWREDYTPFGEARQQPATNDNGESYTGHIADTDTGLIYMQARYYDPAIGRFLSSDPVGFASGGPAYFNRYAYVANNPLNATDPTGMFQEFPTRRSSVHPRRVSLQDVERGGRGTRRGSIGQNQSGDINGGTFDEPMTDFAETTAAVSTELAGAGKLVRGLRLVGRAARSSNNSNTGRGSRGGERIEPSHTAQGSGVEAPASPGAGPTAGGANMSAGQTAMQAVQEVLEQGMDIANDYFPSDPTEGTESYEEQPRDEPFLPDPDF